MVKNEINLKVKSTYVKKFKEGYPLISKEAIFNLDDINEEGTIINLVDDRNQFLAKGYYGIQNKGCGWVLSRKEKEPIDQDFFNKKLQAALQYRSRFFQDADTTAFRVFNGEGDGIGGLTIDYFDSYYLINWYSDGIYQFKALILQALRTLVVCKGIYQKKRFASKGKYIEEDNFVEGERATFPLIVKENGVNLAIDLNDGPMVGAFLDQREVRKTIRDHYAKGKTVFNAFSYTGVFSVFAVKGGAVKTTNVDLANRSKSKTMEQFSVNGIDHEKQEIIVEDVFHYLKYAVRKQLTFDLVILDPPSFSRSKKHTFSAAKDYKNLLKEAIAITASNGLIVASTNAATFGINKFKGFVEKAFKETGGRYKLIEEFSLPSDFKSTQAFGAGNYLKVLFIRKLK